MTHRKCTPASKLAAPLKPLALLFAVTLAACASPQKVDRMHASIYHQQATLQQLESDFEQIQQERQQVASELQRLEAGGNARQEEIQQSRNQLQELDAEQVKLQQVMRQMSNSVASNTQSISTMESKEKKRQAIIREQRERWQQITTQTNTKLAEMDQPQLNPGVESAGGVSNNAQP
jgi:outer membrane murein-binding lipoprotein Lpp